MSILGPNQILGLGNIQGSVKLPRLILPGDFVLMNSQPYVRAEIPTK